MLAAYEQFKSNCEGINAHVNPALARVPSDLFGVCIVGTGGSIEAAGDSHHEFTIMSVSKRFIFALVCELLGPDEMRAKFGVNATGLASNSLESVERFAGPTSPTRQSQAHCERASNWHPRRWAIG
jgi:glutaminase